MNLLETTHVYLRIESRRVSRPLGVSINSVIKLRSLFSAFNLSYVCGYTHTYCMYVISRKSEADTIPS